jgi:Delta7-sterol 5-desaturase
MEHRSYFFYVVLIALRYFITIGIVFWLFYHLLRDKVYSLKIQKIFPKPKDYYREIGYSSLTLLIFSGYAFLVFQTPLRQYTKVYKEISDYGLPYFFVSVALVIFIHDAYFYWMHRLMHHPKIFKWVHLIHHKSVNPSPWAAYAFHPFEALLEGSIILIVVFIIPIHVYAAGLFMFFMLTFNIYGHLGYEIFSKKFTNSRFGKWINTSTSHNMHHKYFNDNYGLYFKFWDVVMKTTNTKQEQKNSIKS